MSLSYKSEVIHSREIKIVNESAFKAKSFSYRKLILNLFEFDVKTSVKCVRNKIILHFQDVSIEYDEPLN